jgi:hypothetical protein
VLVRLLARGSRLWLLALALGKVWFGSRLVALGSGSWLWLSALVMAY